MLIQMRRLLGGAVAVACLFSTFVTLAAPAAHAQQELIEADPDVVRARAEVQAAQLAAHQAANQLEQATQQRDATQASIDEHVAHLADLDAQRADLAAQREVLKADLRQRAISLYRAGGSTGRLEALNADNAVDAARRARLGDIAARTTQQASQSSKTPARSWARCRTPCAPRSPICGNRRRRSTTRSASRSGSRR